MCPAVPAVGPSVKIDVVTRVLSAYWRNSVTRHLQNLEYKIIPLLPLLWSVQ